MAQALIRRKHLSWLTPYATRLDADFVTVALQSDARGEFEVKETRSVPPSAAARWPVVYDGRPHGRLGRPWVQIRLAQNGRQAINDDLALGQRSSHVSPDQDSMCPNPDSTDRPERTHAGSRFMISAGSSSKRTSDRSNRV